MTANRLCAPDSKLGVWERWLETVYLPSCQGLQLRHMYEAMDMFYEHAQEVEKNSFLSYRQPAKGLGPLRHRHRPR